MHRLAPLRVHQTWEAWGGVALGMLTLASPLIVPQPSYEAVLLNAIAVGGALIVLFALDIAKWRRWEEGLAFVLGAWLVASPWVLHYAHSGSLRYWHIAIGGAVMALAALGYWRRRDRTVKG